MGETMRTAGETGQATSDHQGEGAQLHRSLKLTPAAKRALAEAQARRAADRQTPAEPELGGRGGADPARFGDWEVKGIAVDF